jgi:hypothetical protein
MKTKEPMRKVASWGLAALALGFVLWLSMLLGPAGERSRASFAGGSGADEGAPEPAGTEAVAGGARREAVTPAEEPAAEERAAEVATGVTVARARFVDGSGAPLAGVELLAREDTVERALSGADGVAELELDTALFSGSSRALTFEARCPGFARDRRRATADPQALLLLGDWRLSFAGAVEGRVFDEEGSGLSGVRVARLRDGSDDWRWEADRRLCFDALAAPGSEAVTGLDGSFLLEDVPAGRLRVVAVAEDRPAGASEPVDVPAGDVARGVTILMEAADGGTAIAGIVLDPGGRAVPWARVFLSSRAGSTYDVGAGEDGRFRVRLPDREPWDVTASDPAHRYGEALRRGVPAGTIDLELRLSRSSEVELTVLSAEGGPVERFAVAVVAEEDKRSLAFLREGERRGGVVVLVAPGQPFRIEVRANGWLPCRLGPFAPGAVPERLECRLAPAGGVSGVVEAAGEPLAGATVALYAAVETRTTYNGFPVRHETTAAVETASDAGGRFSLSVEERGLFYLRAEAEGLAPAELGPLELDPSCRREERIELEPGGTIAVQVRSQRGASVAGALVALSRGDGRAFTRRAAEDGALRFERLTPGRWQVQLSAEEIDPAQGATYWGGKSGGEIPANCTVLAGEVTRVELWLEDGTAGRCRLTGTLVIDGEPAAGWLATLDREGTAAAEPAAFAEPGVFRLSVEEPGSYRLRLSALDLRALLVILDPVELHEGERSWSLELETGALEGTLRPGPSPALVFHRWRRGMLECIVPLVPAADGRFRCPLVPAGPGTIVRADPTRPIEEQSPAVLREVTVEAGKTTKADL